MKYFISAIGSDGQRDRGIVNEHGGLESIREHPDVGGKVVDEPTAFDSATDAMLASLNAWGVTPLEGFQIEDEAGNRV